MNFRMRIVLVSVGYTVIAALIFLVGPKIVPLSSDTYVADYVKVVGLGLTVLTGLTAAVTPFILSAGLEAQKRVAVEKVEAYKALYHAMRRYYRSLARLEAGAWTVEKGRDAEKMMEEAEGALVFVNDEAEDEWTSAWQAMHDVAETASEEPTQQRDIWERSVKEIGARMIAFKGRVKSDVLGE